MSICFISFHPLSNLCVGTINVPTVTNGKMQAEKILVIFPRPIGNKLQRLVVYTASL